MKVNVKNRTIFGRDNLDILQAINNNCIDLIYLDPPFNKKKTFFAPIGSSAEGASFDDTFRAEDVKDEWVRSIKEDHPKTYTLLQFANMKEGRLSYDYCYLAYMAIRLIEMHRILKDTGSIYLHCDSTMSHYLKLLMDCIFGESNFMNEIVWCYANPSNSKMNYPRKHDTILFFTKSSGSHTFNWEKITLAHKRIDKAVSGGWNSSKKVGGGNLGKKCPSWWIDIPPASKLHRERTGYPTQKPVALLRRIIEASSNKGDMVLDPFCGCATTCIAAEQTDREWIGIDKSLMAYDLVKQRLNKEIGDEQLFGKEIIRRIDTPKLSSKQEVEKKYVYIISHPKQKLFKVGIASDPKQRLNQYQTADSERAYKLEFSLKCEHFREVEQRVHSEHNALSEWCFGTVEELVASIRKHAKETKDERLL